jgi:hypothetical protein
MARNTPRSSTARILLLSALSVSLGTQAKAQDSSPAQTLRTTPGITSLDRIDGGRAEAGGFVVREGVLCFSDSKALERTYHELRALDRLTRATVKDEDLVRQVFEDENGFHSLRGVFRDNETVTTSRGTVIDELTMPDPWFQLLLNAEGELAVGPHLLIFDSDAIRSLPIESLTTPRTSWNVAAAPASYPSAAGQATSSSPLLLCWSKAARSGTNSFASGTRRLTARSWVYNINIFGFTLSSAGVSTVNKAKVQIFFFSIWVWSSADAMSATGDLQLSTSGCVAGTPTLFSSSQAGAVWVGDSVFSTSVNFTVVDHFTSTHTATDNSGSTTINLAF